MAEYTLDNAWQQARQRLAFLEAWLDPGTFQHLDALGVGDGWQCLEVGAGGGSVVTWLCQRVGRTGRVVATDINTQFLDTLQAPNLEVRRHDLLTDPLPAPTFDLTHTRLVLTHLTQRQQALHNLLATLKPGGILLVEEMDCCTWIPDPAGDPAAAALFLKGTHVLDQVMSAAGVNLFYGRRLFGELRAAGLRQMAGQGRVLMVHGGTPTAQEFRLTAEQLFSREAATGLLSGQERREFLVLLDRPDFVWMGPMIMAVWGQRAPVSG
jgi:SAM-dependent methyltransferase